MSEAPPTGPSSTIRVLKWLLGAQVALAGLLILIDLGPTIPTLIAPSRAPALDQPTSPGDQTRHYHPNRPTEPGPGISPDMPRRLVAETLDVEGASVMRLRGAIAAGDGDRIAAELRAQMPALTPARIQLDSPGGSVGDALSIGRVIRALAAETELARGAVCFSACPYMFVGGVQRQIAEGARLGVHQHSFGQSTMLPAFLAVEDIQRGQAEVLDHLGQMGIDLRIMGPAMATPANEIYILSPEELMEWDVVTAEPPE